MLTASGDINVSQSKVKAFRDCKRKFYNKYVLGLQRKTRKRPFMFGGIMHQMAEAAFEREDPFKLLDQIEFDNRKLFRREVEMYGNLVEDMRDIMTDYFDYWDSHPTDKVKAIKFGGRRSEHEFRIELGKQLWFTGKIDGAVKSRKLRWAMEHKTFTRMPGEGERWRSVQAAVYLKALEIIGFDRIDGVLWDYVSSKPCNVPGQLTATGKVSQARIDTLPSRVLRWAREEGIKKADYQKLLADATENRRNRFVRIYSPVKRAVVKDIWGDFLETAKEIQDTFGQKKARNIGRQCDWCDYSLLCKAEVTGADVEWVLKREYEKEDLSHKRENDDRSED